MRLGAGGIKLLQGFSTLANWQMSKNPWGNVTPYIRRYACMAASPAARRFAFAS